MFNSLIGMFAFAIFDSDKQEVFVARDRAGVKPLYIYNCNDIFLFASELKSFTKNDAFHKTIDINAFSQYFKWGYIPAPYSIFRNAIKLQSGHYGILNLKNKRFTITKYWDVMDFYKLPILNISYEEAKEELEKLLISACNYRMIADVPVGIFLSGGYDSTGVTAILQKEKTEKLKTFTIGFEEGINEAPYAKRIAAYIGTEHTEYICTNEDAYKLIPELPYFYDEPFADISAIPTMLVSQIARKDVTVALSADGGDENFAGYTHYVDNNSLYRQFLKISKIPCHSFMVSLLKRLVPQYYSTYNKLELFQSLFCTGKKHRFSSLCENISCTGTLFRHMLKTGIYPVNTIKLCDNELNEMKNIPLAMDYQSYLQDDILTKVDRATMSVSLEGREPLIDHRIIEFMAQIPYLYKNDGNTQKRIYRDIVHTYVPARLMERTKTGFGAPLFSWLQKDLSWIVNEFLENEFLSDDLYNIAHVISLKRKFLENETSYSQNFFLWKIISFQMWYRKWMI
jgi:asparagine synthase (glutamine-hydrolysing)